MKPLVLTALCLCLYTHHSTGQSPRLASREIPPPLGNIQSVTDSIFFNGHDSTFWKKNKYFDLTAVKSKDTSFIFGRMYRPDCTGYFRLTVTDTSKVIFLFTYQPGHNPTPVPIDSMYVACRISTCGMIRTCSFYLKGNWGGMGAMTTCVDKTKGCNTMLSSSPVNFILNAGRFSFQI